MRQPIRPALLALWSTALTAAAANLLILWAGTAANGTDVIAEQQGMELVVGVIAVIAASVAGAVMAAVGALVIVRLFAKRGVVIFAVAGAILTLLSLFGAQAAQTATGDAMLSAMHLVTGTVVVVGNAVIHSKAKARAAVSTR